MYIYGRKPRYNLRRTSTRFRPEVEIGSLYTHSGFRRSGLATSVMREVIEHFGNTHDLTLTAIPFSPEIGLDLPGLLKWYKTFGFRCVRETKMIRFAA